MSFDKFSNQNFSLVIPSPCAQDIIYAMPFLKALKVCYVFLKCDLLSCIIGNHCCHKKHCAMFIFFCATIFGNIIATSSKMSLGSWIEEHHKYHILSSSLSSSSKSSCKRGRRQQGGRFLPGGLQEPRRRPGWRRWSGPPPSRTRTRCRPPPGC